MTQIPAPDVPDPQMDAGESDALWSMLDRYRALLVKKCAGLDHDALATRAVPPSNLTLLGLLRHMADVEMYWFEFVFAGQSVNFRFDPEQNDADFDRLDTDTPLEVLHVYNETLTRCRSLTAGVDLGTRSVRRRHDGHVNLRFIVIHLIEEYARHCGHADLLREVLDGETGD
jgi:hypothetical protein